jgi:hypothetical protein
MTNAIKLLRNTATTAAFTTSSTSPTTSTTPTKIENILGQVISIDYSWTECGEWDDLPAAF